MWFIDPMSVKALGEAQVNISTNKDEHNPEAKVLSDENNLHRILSLISQIVN